MDAVQQRYSAGNAMQDDLGLFPCVANALLADERFPCHL